MGSKMLSLSRCNVNCFLFLQVSLEEEKKLLVVKSFISVMEDHVELPSYNIADDAVMDWFGRSICGRSSIISFAKTHLPKCQHKIEEIIRLPRVSHRLLKRVKRNEIKSSTQQGNSQEDGNGQRTPDNPICPNLEALVKAPKGKKRHWTVDCTDLEFVEIKGSLQYEHTFFDGTTTRLVKRELKKIVLGYSDEIHFLEYSKVMPSCRVNLSHRFRNCS